MPCTRHRFPYPRSRTQHSLVSGWIKSPRILLNFQSAFKRYRKVKRNENVYHVQDPGSVPKVKVTARVKGQLKGPSGAICYTLYHFLFLYRSNMHSIIIPPSNCTPLKHSLRGGGGGEGYTIFTLSFLPSVCPFIHPKHIKLAPICFKFCTVFERGIQFSRPTFRLPSFCPSATY